MELVRPRPWNKQDFLEYVHEYTIGMVIWTLWILILLLGESKNGQ